MCLTIIEYNCGHTEREHKPCREYFECVRTAKRNTGFWKSLFYRPKAMSIICPAPPGRRAMYRNCPHCADIEAEKEAWKRADAADARKRWDARREEEARIARNTWDTANEEMKAQIRRTREEHAKINQQREREKARMQAKLTFFCSACTAEERYVDAGAREANGGLCCARGIDEFPKWEKHGYAGVSFLTPAPSRKRHTDIPRDGYSLSLGNSYTSVSKSNGTIKAKSKASAAAKGYGWKHSNRESAALEPHLVREYVNISGADASALPAPRSKALPLHQELLIDEEQWASAHRTAHGRLPPVMNKPLPVLPLSTRQIPQNSLPNPKHTHRTRTPHYVNATRHFSSPQPSRRCKIPDVSPLSQALPSSSSIISQLGHNIDDELRSWNGMVRSRHLSIKNENSQPRTM